MQKPFFRNREIPYSFPINEPKLACVASLGVQTGLLVAYASGDCIIVLLEGQSFSAILRGHKLYICTVSFESRDPHIISADIEGNCLFWHFQENSWQNNRSVRLSSPPTSIAWCGFRREIYYSADGNLFCSSVSSFGNERSLIASNSKYCVFNSDATIVTSHNGKNHLSIFSISSNPRFSQTIFLPSSIEFVDFSSQNTIFLTYTSDKVIRIWKLSNQRLYQCTSSVSSPFMGRFLKTPKLYPDSKTCLDHKNPKLVFVDSQHKIIESEVLENGRLLSNRLLNESSGNIDKSFFMIGAHKTHQGTMVLCIDVNSVSVIKRPKRSGEERGSKLLSRYLFHESPVTQFNFSPNSMSAFSLDKSGTLIYWPLSITTLYPIIISKGVEIAAWMGEMVVVFIKSNIMYSYNIQKGNIDTIMFPILMHSKAIITIQENICVLSKNGIIMQDNVHNLPEFEFFSISKEYKNNRLLVITNKKILKAYLLPSFQVIKCPVLDTNPKSICCCTVSSFALLYQNNIEFYRYYCDSFNLTSRIAICGLLGIYGDFSTIGGRIIGYDKEKIYSFEGETNLLFTCPLITGVDISSNGDIALLSNHSFYILYELSSQNELSPTKKIPDIFNQTLPIYAPFPSLYLGPSDNQISVIRSSLIILLEFKSAFQLSNCTPIQTPAIPNQYTNPDALQLPDNFDSTYKEALEEVKSLYTVLDMYGVRFLIGLFLSKRPPPFSAIWLSFSSSQSQIVEKISSIISVSDLSPFFISVCIHSHSLLESIVLKALDNTWKEHKNVEIVAHLYAALGKVSKIAKLYNAIGEHQKSSFFESDFSNEKNKKRAERNAYSALSHHGFEMAIALFIISGNIDSAVSVSINNLKDPFLAMLILRLYYKNLENRELIKFSSKLEWKDDVIPILMANLLNKAALPELLGKYFENKHPATVFGDPKIAIFQIFWHICPSPNIVSKIVSELVNQGLSPLAHYLLEYTRSYSSKPRIIHVKESDFVEEEKEPEDDPMSNDDFDFGGGASWNESESSSWSDSENESHIDPSIDEFKPSIMNQDSIFDIYIDECVRSLSNLFSDTQKEDYYAFEFAQKFGNHSISRDHCSEQTKSKIVNRVSLFIDFCCDLYIRSAFVPISPMSLISLAYMLYELVSNEKCIPIIDLSLLHRFTNSQYIHSVYYGAFVVSLWTFSHNFLAQLLGSDQVTKSVYLPSELPPAQAYLNADILPPRFPDSVPNLLRRYSTGPVTIIDRDRVLVIAVIFQKFYSCVEQCFEISNIQWIETVLTRMKSFYRTFLYYQIAYSSPCIECPSFSHEDVDPLSKIVFETHMNKKQVLLKINQKAISRLLSTAVFKGGSLSLANQKEKSITNASIRQILQSPIFPDRYIVLADQIYIITLDDKGTITPIYGFSQSEINDIISIIAHPRFELFLALTHNGAIVFDQGQKGDTTISIPTADWYLHASFSPNGSKIAIFSTSVIIVPFESRLCNLTPIYGKDIGFPCVCSSWINSDTRIVIGTNQPYLSLLDILTDEVYNTEYPFSWGSPLFMIYESKKSLLIFSTNVGMIAVCDGKQNFDRFFVYSFRSQIISLSLLTNLVVSSSEDGQVVAFSPFRQETPHSSPLNYSIGCFIASDTRVIISEKGKGTIVYWEA